MLLVTMMVMVVMVIALPYWNGRDSVDQVVTENVLRDTFVEFIRSYNPKMTYIEIEEIVAAVMDSAERNQLDPRLLVALIAVESGFRRYAVSHRGARGLTQIMPDKCQQDWTDIRYNVERGSSYLKEQVVAFSSLPKALAAYNAGPSRARKGYQYYPRETRLYIHKVLKIYDGLIQTTDIESETVRNASLPFFYPKCNLGVGRIKVSFFTSIVLIQRRISDMNKINAIWKC